MSKEETTPRSLSQREWFDTIGELFLAVFALEEYLELIAEIHRSMLEDGSWNAEMQSATEDDTEDNADDEDEEEGEEKNDLFFAYEKMRSALAVLLTTLVKNQKLQEKCRRHLFNNYGIELGKIAIDEEKDNVVPFRRPSKE